jgi:hypothetical protein
MHSIITACHSFVFTMLLSYCGRFLQIHIAPIRLYFYFWRDVLDTTLCDKVYHWLATGRWFSPGLPVSITNKIDRHDIAEILFIVVLNIVTLLVWECLEWNNKIYLFIKKYSLTCANKVSKAVHIPVIIDTPVTFITWSKQTN